MPIYEYEHDAQLGPECSARFEVLQRVQEEPLAHCPTCGFACHRVLSSFATARATRSGWSSKADLSPSNLERLGFTQYRRAKGGRYEKTCGRGPSVINRS
jgi:putative FmdB family regulatory protein